ncbi:hypothetical protein D3C78_1287920 [compost metagenome]
MRCQACNSVRAIAPCFKCGGPLIEPHPEWDEPKLPDVEPIRQVAKVVGYAIGEHGSKERDLDLIAAPWTEDAVDAHTLIEHLANALSLRIIDIEAKPLGRIAVTLQCTGWYRPIDLSICPRL